MQAASARRKKFVQTLRRCALAHGVERVPDNANRDRVRTMALSLLEAVTDDGSLPDEDREEIENAWASYQDLGCLVAAGVSPEHAKMQELVPTSHLFKEALSRLHVSVLR
jgi:hypothetical protein